MMKSLVFWGFRPCRSVLAWFKEMGAQFDVPVQVYLAEVSMGDNRIKSGFTDAEFGSESFLQIEDEDTWIMGIIKKNPDALHLLSGYQAHPLLQRTWSRLRNNGCKIGIFSEAPLNMLTPGPRRLLKNIYLSSILPVRCRKYISGSEFIINLSGCDKSSLLRLGWPEDKILDGGYFPLPLVGSRFVQRHQQREIPQLLITGLPEWHRGHDLILPELALLRKKGVNFSATFTGSGSNYPALKSNALRLGLQNETQFPGFFSFEQLLEAYQSCDFFIAGGREEPWGMRVNDAVHCGAPILVSSGMGISDTIKHLNAGLIFDPCRTGELSEALFGALSDDKVWSNMTRDSALLSEFLMPSQASARFKSLLHERFTYLFDEQ